MSDGLSRLDAKSTKNVVERARKSGSAGQGWSGGSFREFTPR